MEALRSGVEFAALPDRVEASTFACAAAVTRSVIELKHVVPADLAPVTRALEAMGCRLALLAPDRLRVDAARGPMVGTEVRGWTHRFFVFSVYTDRKFRIWRKYGANRCVFTPGGDDGAAPRVPDGRPGSVDGGAVRGGGAQRGEGNGVRGEAETRGTTQENGREYRGGGRGDDSGSNGTEP